MSYLNSVTIIGFVGADPEQRQARNNNGSQFFDEARLRELAANIQLHGVLQAILVRPSQDGRSSGAPRQNVNQK